MFYILYLRPKGELAEWLKAHAWKACILQKGIEGSNPSLSAIKGKCPVSIVVQGVFY